jgi:hypothetical protein
MMNELTDRFAQLLHSRWGSFAQWATGAIIGYLVSLAAKHGMDLSPTVQEFLTEALTIGFAFIATFAVQWYQSVQTQQLQKIIKSDQPQVRVDGWIGEKTIEAVQEVVTEAKS